MLFSIASADVCNNEMLLNIFVGDIAGTVDAQIGQADEGMVIAITQYVPFKYT